MSLIADPPAPSVTGPITRTDIVRYQGASGDMYRVHHDDEYARSLGFPGVFSVGMFQAGLVAAWAVRWLGAENVRRFRVRFQEQVWPGDVLTCSGSVAHLYQSGAEARVDVDLQCTRQTGGLAVKGWATFVVPSNATEMPIAGCRITPEP